MSSVRVLIAPDRYAGLLDAAQAAEAIAGGWSQGAPHDSLGWLALTDGGPGFVDVIASATGGELQMITVRDPWGRSTPATLLVSPDGSTVFLEAAQVCGAHLLQRGDDPLAATSAGLGQLLEVALGLRPSRIIVGLSGALTVDLGLGMVSALAPGTDPGADAILRGGARGLGGLAPDDLAGLTSAAQRFAGVTLVGLGDLQQPLLGLAGVAATHAPRLGADASAAHRIESSLSHAVALIRRSRPEPTDLLSGAALRLDRKPGVGAGAGVGFGLSLLGAAIRDGGSEGLALVGAADSLRGVDLVVTGTAVLGWESLRSSPSTAIAQAAQAHGIPAIAVCGRVEAGRRETMAAGFSGTYAATSSLAGWPAFAAHPERALAARAAAVARTWSPPAPPVSPGPDSRSAD